MKVIPFPFFINLNFIQFQYQFQFQIHTIVLWDQILHLKLKAQTLIPRPQFYMLNEALNIFVLSHILTISQNFQFLDPLTSFEWREYESCYLISYALCYIILETEINTQHKSLWTNLISTMKLIPTSILKFLKASITLYFTTTYFKSYKFIWINFRSLMLCFTEWKKPYSFWIQNTPPSFYSLLSPQSWVSFEFGISFKKCKGNWIAKK